MPTKSRWDSDFWKAVKLISAVLGGLAGSLAILQFLANVDVWNLLFVPVSNFFNLPVPLYSIPLTVIVVFVVILLIENIGRSTPPISQPNPLEGADMLDDDFARIVANLCRTPQTADTLKEAYQKFQFTYDLHTRYSFEDCMQQLEHRRLVTFQDEKWTTTQKALEYIKKFHGTS